MKLIVDKQSNYVVGSTSADCPASDKFDYIEYNAPLPDKEVIYVEGELIEIPVCKPSHKHTWNGVEWIDTSPLPTYIDNRTNEYPPLEEQLDMLFHAMDRGEIPVANEWYNTIKNIKQNNPKE